MSSRYLAVLLSVVALAFAAAGAAAPELRSGVFKPPRPAPDFSLQGSDGAPLSLSRYRAKKVVAVGFGFTHCADTCPTTLAQLAHVKKKLGAAGKDFQVVYITVDPQRDSPARLKEYLTAFDPTFVGATGAPGQLEEVRKTYGILATKEMVKGSNSDYRVHHSSFVYLVDLEGNLRAMVPFGAPIDDVVHDVRALLADTRKLSRVRDK